MCIDHNEFEYFSPQKDKLFKARVESALVPGAAVAFHRKSLLYSYFHFGIVLGRNNCREQWFVIHMSPMERPTKEFDVDIKVERFWDVTEDSSVQIYKCPCDAEQQARSIRKAISWLGVPMKYALETWNCESWTRKVLNGEALSTQTFKHPAIARAINFLRPGFSTVSSSFASCRVDVWPGACRIFRFRDPVGIVRTLKYWCDEMRWENSEGPVDPIQKISLDWFACPTDPEIEGREICAEFLGPAGPRGKGIGIARQFLSAMHEVPFNQDEFSTGKCLHIVRQGKVLSHEAPFIALIAENGDIPFLLEVSFLDIRVASRIDGKWQPQESMVTVNGNHAIESFSNTLFKASICNGSSGYEIYLGGRGEEFIAEIFVPRTNQFAIRKCLVRMFHDEKDAEIFITNSF